MRTYAALMLLIALGLCLNSYGHQMSEDGPEEGEYAPDFTLKGLDGKEVTLSDLRWTEPVVLIFGSCT